MGLCLGNGSSNDHILIGCIENTYCVIYVYFPVISKYFTEMFLWCKELGPLSGYKLENSSMARTVLVPMSLHNLIKSLMTALTNRSLPLISEAFSSANQMRCRFTVTTISLLNFDIFSCFLETLFDKSVNSASC